MRLVESGLAELKIGFLTPFYKENRGNATTAKRLEAGLTEAGIKVVRFTYGEEVWSEKTKKQLESCHLLHILHFERFLQWKDQITDFPDKPYIVTAGGTDIHQGMIQLDKLEKMGLFLKNAEQVVVFSPDSKRRVEDAFTLDQPVSVIPQSIWFPSTSLINSIDISADPAVLLPAGLRPVKDVLFLYEPLKKLQARQFPNLKWVIMGPILDKAVYKSVMKVQKETNWVFYIGEIPFSEVPKWYKWADVVINSSKSEGQSSAILEAMGLGVPVLARDIPGNRSLIKDGKTGLLFDTEEVFIQKFAELFSDQTLRESLVQTAKLVIEERHSLKKEIQAYIEIYYRVCLKSGY